jgi:hypothetical protein
VQQQLRNAVNKDQSHAAVERLERVLFKARQLQQLILPRGATTGQKLRGTIMASAGARAYMGVWGLCPQWGPGAKPLVRGSGGKAP